MIRDDEEAAAYLGVGRPNHLGIYYLLYQLRLPAARGALILAHTIFITPTSIFGVRRWSAIMIFMVLIGGLGTFRGRSWGR